MARPTSLNFKDQNTLNVGFGHQTKGLLITKHTFVVLANKLWEIFMLRWLILFSKSIRCYRSQYLLESSGKCQIVWPHAKKNLLTAMIKIYSFIHLMCVSASRGYTAHELMVCPTTASQLWNLWDSPQSFTPKKEMGLLSIGSPLVCMCVCVSVSNGAPWQQLIVKALHSCDAYRGVWGLRARQAIRKALTVSDRHSLWLCNPIRAHKL